MPADCFIGIDGGGSKTVGVVIDRDGCVLASARLGGSSIVGPPTPRACGVLSAVKRRLCSAAGISPGDIAGVGLGLNGVDFADEHAMQHGALSACLEVPGADLALVNDGIVALWGASAADKAAIVQHGSAFTHAYRSSYGSELLFDHLDVGRAFDIRQALAALVARMIDGRAAATPLKEAALRAYGVEDEADYAESLFRGRIPRERLAAGSTVTFAAWQAHDAAATRLVEQAADDYACTACALAARVGDARCQAAFGGGVIAHAPDAFIELLAARVHAAFPAAAVARPRLSPAHGAAIMAAFRHGIDPAALYRRMPHDVTAPDTPEG